MYAEAVDDAGAAPYLLQRTVDNAFGHTGIADLDIIAAFFDLVDWVHSGVKPLN